MPRLRHVEPYAAPGYTRVRRGRGFAYVHSDGGSAGTAERARISDLAIPPAWNDVWIADRPNAHILAVGVDAAGRRQYLYHPAWREARDALKFERMLELARVLPAARREVERDLKLPELPRERVLAAAFRTLDAGAIRVGSEESLAGYRSRGLTTLLVRNAALEGDAVRLRFRAKGGIRQDLRIPDTGLASFVDRSAQRASTARLFAWLDGRRARSLGPSDVNEHVRERTGGDFTAKDFRTLRGTVTAAERLAELGPAGTARSRRDALREAVEQASTVLGNTPTIAKGSYIDPRVFAAFEEGRTLSLRGARERALLELLEPPGSEVEESELDGSDSGRSA
ncbi:DNA topoisomerase IB [Agromyces salentinus]|uniref:DNA topoisomerase n=1 Tax=Agromyces salentinus TaxID=269421 RepID=A0ABN2MVN8_9MICO|nr:DNA topoisomerase IB [Agromyces salentinus]